MPNWVATTLTAPKEVIDFMISKDKEGNDWFDFNNIIPQPKHQPDLDKPNPFWGKDIGSEDKQKFPGDMNWYGWAPKHWGTKWNACDTNVYAGGETVFFQTAWSPADPVFEALSAKFPEAMIVTTYEDEGGGFKGIQTFQGGISVEDIDLTWHFEMDRECPREDCNSEYGYVSGGNTLRAQITCEECGNSFYVTRKGKKTIIPYGEEE